MVKNNYKKIVCCSSDLCFVISEFVLFLLILSLLSFDSLLLYIGAKCKIGII